MDFRQHRRLLRIFSSILAPMAVGCGGADEIDLDQFTEDLCGEGRQMRVLDAVEPAEPADYLELREAEDYGFDGMAEWSSPRTLDASGTLCAGASDPASCQEQFDALPLDSDFLSWGSDVPSYRSVALTRGDEVAAVGTSAALLAMLGPIDAPGDAALHALLDNRSIVCRDGNDVGERGDGYVVHTRSGGGCGPGDDIEEHVVLVNPDGTIEVLQTVLVEEGDPNCAVGRLPAGLCAQRRVTQSVDPAGTFFAEVAHLEAAAVTAFEQLATELSVHGAPRSFVAAAQRSRRDEIRHARVTAALARRYGGRPVAPRVEAQPPRSLEAVACDNAAEGCIRETYGALVAHAQARRARNPRVRRALGRIAHEETRHAALSWTLARWAEARMTPAQRRRVARQTKDALGRLELELCQAYHPRVHREAGMPEPEQAHALFRQLRRSLFTGAVA